MTEDEVRAFQGEHFNHLGTRLRVDGDLGPQTRWALDIETLHVERQRIVRMALGCIGVTEGGDNRHPRVDAWLRDCGAPLGSAWCAAMASHCLGHVRIAGAQALGRHFPVTIQPVPGDVLWFPTGAWQGHCGIVTGVTLSEVMSVEGNLRNACRVARRKRATVHFARVHEDISGACPGIPPGVPWEETRSSTEGTR